jgi:hypothetical protein
MREYFVYQLRLVTDTLPFYVGKGYGNRPAAHFQEQSLKKNTHKTAVIKKALASSIEIIVEFVFKGLSNDEALAYEIWTIAAYGRRKYDGGCLTNQTSGGEGVTGYKHSEESLKKISVASIGRTPTAETRAKISKAQKGRPVSAETRANISRARRMYPNVVSAETRRKLSEANRGKTTSEETRARMSTAMTGLKRSAEGKENMRVANQALPRVKCNHCEVCGVQRQISRYHNDNCKNRPT